MFLSIIVYCRYYHLFSVDNHLLSTIYLKAHTYLREDNNVKMARDEMGCIGRKNKLIYVHILKNGGATIEAAELLADTYLPRGYR